MLEQQWLILSTNGKNKSKKSTHFSKRVYGCIFAALPAKVLARAGSIFL
jgi:hypothetical protein